MPSPKNNTSLCRGAVIQKTTTKTSLPTSNDFPTGSHFFGFFIPMPSDVMLTHICLM